jgi:hypothetical protein
MGNVDVSKTELPDGRRISKPVRPCSDESAVIEEE